MINLIYLKVSLNAQKHTNMNNVLEILIDSYSRAVFDMLQYRRWAKETASMGGYKEADYWGYAFRNLAIAKEFKGAIQILLEAEFNRQQKELELPNSKIMFAKKRNFWF